MKNKKEKLKIIEKDGVSLNQETINCMKKNKNKILHSAYILNKTSTMIDSILATPRNLLQIDSPILTEALEDKECQKEFKNSQEEVKNMNKEDLPLLMYDVITDLKCDEESIIKCIAIAQKAKEDLMKGIQENDVFKIAKSIWFLRAYTTSITFFVDASKSFFESTGLIDMYKFLHLAAKTHADQVMAIENLMYEEM